MSRLCPQRSTPPLVRPSSSAGPPTALLLVSAGLYDIRLDNQDDYLDFVSVQVMCWACMVEEGGLRPEGLLGRTWDRQRTFIGREAEEELDKYREHDQDIFGCNTHYDQFCRHNQGLDGGSQKWGSRNEGQSQTEAQWRQKEVAGGER